MRETQDLLKEHNLNITQVRVELLDFIRASKKPISIFDFKSSELFQKMNESSIYRNLTKFDEVGLIQPIPSSNDFQSYEFTKKEHHHHHIQCNRCQKIQCLEVCLVSDQFNKMASDAGFTLSGHSFELFGTCTDCSKLN